MVTSTALALIVVSTAHRLVNAIHIHHDRHVPADVVRLTDPNRANKYLARGKEPHGCGPQSTEIKDMWNHVSKLKPVSDKFTSHSYQTMYGLFLAPWRTSNEGPKLLEIGLGCRMGYGPGASVKAWTSLLPYVELWEADYDEACVNKSKEAGQLKDIGVVTGDQGDPNVVAQWVETSGGKYDVVVDDGGHKNTQIKTSFDGLWPHMKPGGLYFIEDLQVGRKTKWDDTNGQAVMSDIIQSWIEQLLISKPDSKFPLPQDVLFILCQHEACVIGKK